MSALLQEWTEKLSDWHSSGLSIAAWCRKNAEGYHRFLYWRNRLKAQQSLPSGRFVELTLGHDRDHLSLECNGVHIHLAQGFDPGLLRDVLTLLKQV